MPASLGKFTTKPPRFVKEEQQPNHAMTRETCHHGDTIARVCTYALTFRSNVVYSIISGVRFRSVLLSIDVCIQPLAVNVSTSHNRESQLLFLGPVYRSHCRRCPSRPFEKPGGESMGTPNSLHPVYSKSVQVRTVSRYIHVYVRISLSAKRHVISSVRFRSASDASAPRYRLSSMCRHVLTPQTLRSDRPHQLLLHVHFPVIRLQLLTCALNVPLVAPGTNTSQSSSHTLRLRPRLSQVGTTVLGFPRRTAAKLDSTCYEVRGYACTCVLAFRSNAMLDISSVRSRSGSR